MSRTKTTPTSTAPRPTRKWKETIPKPAAVNYTKKKNDWLLGELDRRGVARPAEPIKKNLVAALQQDDADKAAASPRRVQGGAGVSKAPKGGLTARPSYIRTRPQTSFTRLQLLQKTLLDILGWVLIEEDEHRLDPVARALSRANVELGRVMAPYWRPSLPDPPSMRAMSVGAPSRSLALTGAPRHGSVGFYTTTSPTRQAPTILNTRAASVGAEPVRTSPLRSPPRIEELVDELLDEEEVDAAPGENEEGDELEDDDQEDDELQQDD